MKRIILYISVVVSVALSACSRSSDTIGPAICPSESFTVIAGQDLKIKNNADNSESLLDLSASYAKVTMGFNESIAYKVSISAASGAEFVYTGKGSTINLNWYGNSTNGVPFQKNDVLTCQVTNGCISEPWVASPITLNTIISYSAGPWLKYINFEDGYSLTGAYPNSNIGGSTATRSIETSSPSPQGGSYLHAEGQCPSNSYYFGGVTLGYPGFSFAPLGSNPDTVYFNIYVKGVPNSQCQVVVTEKVFGMNINRKFLVNATPDWVLSSIKLRDMGIINPSMIQGMEFNFGTIVPALTCSFEADLLLFTYGKPL